MYHEIFSLKSMNEWTFLDVAQWMRQSLSLVDMESYVSNFEAHGNEQFILEELTDEKLLCTFKIKKKSHRKKIQKRLKHFQAWHHQHHQRKKNQDAMNDSSHLSTNSNKIINDGIASNLKQKNLSSPSILCQSSILYVNGVAYSYQQKCTFCMQEHRFAAFYCHECGDFLCDTCDCDVHRHAKRSPHKRHAISKYNAYSAGCVIIGFFRWIIARDILRQKIRSTYERRYDITSKKHYYRHLFTGECQWQKPLTLGNEELKPFLTAEEASLKIMGIYKCWVARQIVHKLINEQYIKFYCLQSGTFQYQYVGRVIEFLSKPKITIRSKFLASISPSNHKPLHLHNRDIAPVLNHDLATMRIQLFMRKCHVQLIVKSMIRNQYQRIFDPVSGNHFYLHERTNLKTWRKPYLLHSERWDPSDVSLWTKLDVMHHFRRLGFAKFGFHRYVDEMDIDGPLLLALESEDYGSMGMLPIHIKKLQLHMLERLSIALFHHSHQKNSSDKLLRRRDSLRKHHKQVNAAKVIQRMCRHHFTYQLHQQTRELFEWYQKKKVMHSSELKKECTWWSDMLEKSNPSSICNHKIIENGHIT